LTCLASWKKKRSIHTRFSVVAGTLITLVLSLAGQTLYTRPAEICRALIEGTAFGALTIINRFEQYGLRVRQIVNCGGIAERNPLVMRIYARRRENESTPAIMTLYSWVDSATLPTAQSGAQR